MKTQLKTIKLAFRQAVLSHLWRHWKVLGVKADGSAGGKTYAIDPEPFLLLSLECAREDPRMFDEIMNWLVVNGQWINTQRLVNLNSEDRLCSINVLGGVAKVISEHGITNWNAVVARCKEGVQKGEKEALFRQIGQPVAMRAVHGDEFFEEFHLYRSKLHLSNKSARIPFDNPENLIFKLRAMFGLNTRADLIGSLLFSESKNAYQLAKHLGFSQRAVLDSLETLVLAGVLVVRRDPRANVYFLSRKKEFFALLDIHENMEPLPWRNHCKRLSPLWQGVLDLKEEGMNDYILNSELRKIFTTPEPLLTAFGFYPSGSQDGVVLLYAYLRWLNPS